MVEAGDAIVNLTLEHVRLMSQNSALPTNPPTAIPASFRDPAGYVFVQGDEVYRHVNAEYLPILDRLHESGLYDALVSDGSLVAHEVTQDVPGQYRVIRPEQIPYVSYPYEWSHGQLKAAASLTLHVQQLALKHGLSLKDASAYNIQFIGSKARFIDTLSFEPLVAERPWVAYKQFCEHFLAPLALMTYGDLASNKLLLGFLDGIPLELASKLLPARSKLSYSLLVHLHLHAKSQSKHSDAGRDGQLQRTANMSQERHKALIASLSSAVEKLSLQHQQTEWSHYYHDTNYSDQAMSSKASAVKALLEQELEQGDVVLDIGANTGRFSRIAADCGAYVVAQDIDMLAVEKHFQALKSEGSTDILPLHLDLTNPSPGIGWAGQERDSIFTRTGDGVILALALIHHLAISNNTPLQQIADVFARLGRALIIEFVPKGDSQVDRLLSSREDIFPKYTEQGFEQAFAHYFDLVSKQAVDGSKRILYHYRTKRG